MPTQHHLFLSWDDSIEIYPDNKAGDFTIELPQILSLEGKWVCALKDVKYSSQNIEYPNFRQCICLLRYRSRFYFPQHKITNIKALCSL